MHFRIPRLYDSHTHFLATGEGASMLKLQSLQKADEVRQLIVRPENFRGKWLIGFGWSADLIPHKNILDGVFSQEPVFFCRADGHASWLNSIALQILGIESSTGLLLEKEHFEAWSRLPMAGDEQRRQIIHKACASYNRAGFTHVRDMDGSEDLWNLLSSMEERGDLTLAVESNFTFHDLNQFEKALSMALQTKKHETGLLRSQGVKFFYDGSLGAETALISVPYRGVSDSYGEVRWSLSDVEEILKKTWACHLEVSVHAIGDEAAHRIVQIARKVSAQGYVGRLNLEHVEILRPETIQMMKPLHVRCHMQPCHWWSDKAWLKEKVGDLYQYCFPWEALRAAQIPVTFGCDSPVTEPSFVANKNALEDSAQAKIRRFKGDLRIHHAHPDPTYADSYSIIENDEVKEVIFCGKSIDLI